MVIKLLYVLYICVNNNRAEMIEKYRLMSGVYICMVGCSEILAYYIKDKL